MRAGRIYLQSEWPLEGGSVRVGPGWISGRERRGCWGSFFIFRFSCLWRGCKLGDSTGRRIFLWVWGVEGKLVRGEC